MLKIVVFDGGWGGEVVANYLSSELDTVEVIRVIDWQSTPYEEKSLPDICRLARKHLSTYIGKVDLIVLGGYASSQALDFLQFAYPKQRFVGMSIDYREIPHLRDCPDQIVILAGSSFVKGSTWQRLQKRLVNANLIIPDCSGWENLIDIGEMSAYIMRRELESYFVLPRRTSVSSSCVPEPALVGATRERSASSNAAISGFLARCQTLARPEIIIPEPEEAYLEYEKLRTDTVLLLNTHFWEVRSEIEEVFGRQVYVLDFRKQLLHDVCLALGLRGVDGRLDRK